MILGASGNYNGLLRVLEGIWNTKILFDNF